MLELNTSRQMQPTPGYPQNASPAPPTSLSKNHLSQKILSLALQSPKNLNLTSHSNNLQQSSEKKSNPFLIFGRQTLRQTSTVRGRDLTTLQSELEKLGEQFQLTKQEGKIPSLFELAGISDSTSQEDMI